VHPGGGARPPTWRRGPRPTAGGGPAAWVPEHGGAPSGSDLPQASWGAGDGGPGEGAAPRQGNPVTPWGPDNETDPNFRGRSPGAGARGGRADEAADTADPSSRNGRADGPRQRHRPSPRRAANLPDVTARNDPDSDAAFVNGGAVYDDPYRPRPEPADDASGEATHRIGGHVSSPEGRDRPRTGQVRRRVDRTTMLDPGMTGPIATQLPADHGGPSTAVGLAPPGAEAWHRDRTGRRGGWDGGPPTEASAPFRLDDDEADGPDDYRDYDDNDEYDNNEDGDRRADADRLGYFDRPNDDPDDHPAGLPAEPQRRVGLGAPSAGQAWAAVVAQWIAGAIGGAALWVGFRFLWRDLPVVALAAAVLVTVGLVLVVRALMHNDDRRTTLFAVLVGLLLTVSPAILVLLGR
jgi:hypothetical protein